jgi:cytosine/adenosine deaminase-related metal-dependent hydrolase
LTLLMARWVLPMTSPPIRDGAVVIEGDRIIAVGEWKEIAREFPAEVWEFPDGVLMPGLVNPHTHLENTNFAETIKRPQTFNKWLLQMVRLVRSQTFEDALQASVRGIEQLTKFGVTCIGEFSRFGASFQALKNSKLRAVVFKEFICLRDEDAERQLGELARWLEDAKGLMNSLLNIGLGPHAPYTVTPTAFRRVVGLAQRENCRICVHAAESPSERKLVEQRKGIWRWWLGSVLRDAPLGLSPIRYLDWLGVLQPETLLVHCVQVDDADIALLAERKVWVAHCPRSNANLTVGLMPLGKMLSAGVKVCLATDGLASVDSLSPLDEIRFAIKVAREHPKLYPALPPSRWLRMVTLDAAASLGLDRFVGSLDAGKQADIAIFRFNASIDNPYDAMLSEGREATATMVAGEFVLQRM